MKRDLTLIVCGGRHYNDRTFLFAALDALHAKRNIIRVIAGGAAGADELAKQWAIARGVEFTIVLADWVQYGKAAGPKRNRKMLTLSPDGVVAFPGGKGTEDMIHAANEAGVKVWQPAG